MALKLRRGTDSERTSIVFGEGEPVYVTDTGELYIGDGSTSGGNRVVSSLSAETTPSLGGPLDLNGNAIVGTGNINIDGNITATGTINLGDGVEDNVIVGGQIASSLIPDADGVSDLGSDSLRWRNGYFEGVDIAGEITVDTISVARIIDQDSSVLYDSGTFTGDGSGLTNLAINEYSIFDLNDAFTFTSPNIGDLLIFDGFNFTPQRIQRIEGEDSTVIVDATTNTFTGKNGFFASLSTNDIFKTDSSVLFSGEDNLINVESLIATQLESPGIIPPDNEVFIFSEDSTSPVAVNVQSQNENSGDLRLLSQSLTQDLTTNNTIYGRILFERNDINGSLATGIIGAGRDNMFFASDPNGNVTAGDFENFVVLESGNLVIGGLSPNYKLDVRGEAVIESYVQFGSLTTTERNALVSENGMVIYNTTDNKFQGYQNGAWINLDDGTAA